MLLALDTSTGACSVALYANQDILASAFKIMPRGHAEALAPMVDGVMDKAGIAYSGLTRLGVTLGPGTFTGVRIGLAFARSLAASLALPLTGISTLSAIAANVSSGSVAAIMDARRGEVYSQCFDPDGRPMDEPAALEPEAAAARLPEGKLALAGTGSHLVLEAAGVKGREWSVHAGCEFPDARNIARLAANTPASDEIPRPLYLRAPDAKLPQAAGLVL